jgi:hypothetical protein
VLQFGANGGIYANGTKIGKTKAGNRFKVASLFGRAYIAISDADHGADVPLQYDGQNLDRVSQDGPGAPPTVTNQALASTEAVTLTRTDGVVTATTSSAHGLMAGNQFVLSNVPAAVVGGSIVSIVIDNDANYGVATITTSTAHGLVPSDEVALNNVQSVSVGGGIVTTNVTGGVETITTASAHGLTAGQNVLARVGTGPYYPATVNNVLSATVFTFLTPVANTDATGGDVLLTFPLSTDPDSNIFTVSETPTATTFQIPISYGNGTWTTGDLTFAWNGTFYVISGSGDTLTYSQPGPDGTVTVGTLTPQGQISPGTHKVACLFITRTGFTTAPSPTVSWIANGSQYARLTDIPIGPSNVIGRAILFTGAEGAKFFYLPVAPQLSGMVSGTSTVINDNVTTEAVFDFSDTALFGGLAVDIEGNNLFRQVVLGPCLGFYPYAGRLLAWGERNKIQQFLNMGFEGGTKVANTPLGWNLNGGGQLVASPDYGVAWQPQIGTVISQPAYQDQNGVAILLSNTQYTFRAWTTGTVTADLYSATQGVLATATIRANSGFGETTFSAKTPAVIPADAVFNVYNATGDIMDELEIYYTDNPYLKSARVSYVNNPEAFDGVTGQLGPASDPHEIRAMFVRRDILNILTDGPNGALYETQDTASAEPANWNVQMVAAKCGAISVWGDAQFEDWQVWASDTGLTDPRRFERRQDQPGSADVVGYVQPGSA